ncbi:unnamed protein product [Notodromas monacha]|uniref:P-type domain-containing protein n=1 Tax=Notodromas monacha TaxID=399045 RepID=A0A7R9BLE6_9CRUS|nr:unnamed protein product [Notodromas monacha]CAG0916795.1 unnamed protein product [Notodromas monacha]
MKKKVDKEMLVDVELHSEQDGPQQHPKKSETGKGSGFKLNSIQFYLLNNKMRTLYALTLCLVVAGLIPLAVNVFQPVMRPLPVNPGLCFLQESFRVECKPGSDQTVGLDACSSLDCCWRDDSQTSLFVPICYHSVPSKYTYLVENVQGFGNEVLYDLVTRYGNKKTPLDNPAHVKAQIKLEQLPMGMNGTIRISIGPQQKRRKGFNRIYNSTLDVDIWESVMVEPNMYYALDLERASTGEKLVHSNIGALVISENFIEITLSPGTTKLVGFGGDSNSFQLPMDFGYHKAVMYNRKEPNDLMASVAVPFYIAIEKSGKAHGPTPLDVMKQYTTLVGKPEALSYSAFGYHMCREVGNFSAVQSLYAAMDESDYPFESDCIFSKPFTQSAFNFITSEVDIAALREAVNTLHRKERKFVIQQVPHVASSDEAGNLISLEKPVFLLNSSQEVYHGTYKRQDVLFPDPIAPMVNSWAQEEFLKLTVKLGAQVDGIILTSNSPPDDSPYQDPDPKEVPYSPALSNAQPMMYYQAPWNLINSQGIKHWGIHNKYGSDHLRVVKTALQGQAQERPFVTSANTFAGSGGKGGIPICGDIDSGQIDMEDPFAFGDLCLRWHQLGLNLPLAYNNYKQGAQPRNPPDLGTAYKLHMKVALRQRYRLLPYFYSLSLESVLDHGAPLVRPLFFTFPEDEEAFKIDEQFMIGDSLMAIPALWPGVDSVSAYFPPGTWVDFFNGDVFASSDNGTWTRLSVANSRSPLAIRGGHVIFWQEPGAASSQSRKNFFRFTAVIQRGYGAKGHILIDDGKSMISEATSIWKLVGSLDVQETEFNITLEGPPCSAIGMNGLNTAFDGGEIFGLKAKPTAFIDINTGENVEFFFNAATNSLEFAEIPPMDFCDGTQGFYLKYD